MHHPSASRRAPRRRDDLLLSDDMIEGLTAFAQKRHPQGKNR
jgi:hypothetical protein